MRLYLDDNVMDRRPVAQLHRAGRTVVLPADVGRAGAQDAQHFAEAIRQEASLLTRNYQDFIDLHDLILAAGANTPGCCLFTWRMTQSATSPHEASLRLSPGSRWRRCRLGAPSMCSTTGGSEVLCSTADILAPFSLRQGLTDEIVRPAL